MSDSTFSGNSATQVGGAIYNAGTLTLTSATLSGNSAVISYEGTTTPGNCPATVAGQGGGVYGLSSTTQMSNTIVANSPSGGNCFGVGGPITDGGYNIDDGTTCAFSASTSKSSTDPKLDTSGLKDNGGPTRTIALQPISPAIDAIPSGSNGCGTDFATDQRGVMRPQDGDTNGTAACDIGAFELQPPALSINDTTVAEGNSGTSSATFTVSLSRASVQTVTVDYATAKDTASAGTDYETTIGSLTFPAGTTSQTITVPVIGDNVDEVDETFFVNLSNATNATISDAQGKGTITDDDPLPDTTPPSVSCSVSPNTLRLPANNHKLVTVMASVTVTDSGSGANSFELVSVTSNQADSGLGKDDVPNDIQGWTIGTNDTSGQLRAERYRTDRIYTLTYRGKDVAGNTKDCQATVKVPKG